MIFTYFKKRILTVLLIILSATALWSNETGISGIPVSDYVRGRFSPARTSGFVELKKAGVPCARRGMYLRSEAVNALKKMLQDFRASHRDIKIVVISATRNFNSQKRIWNGKWQGRRRVTGVKDIRSVKDPVKRARIILNYSSMPGTSRHHWGSDFDINSLNNRYYEKGQGLVIYRWLRANAGKYGFCQPYTAGRDGGYKEEKWHWSYMPLAGSFLRQWNRIYREKPSLFTAKGLFEGSAEAGRLAPLYVNTIDGSCR